MHNYNDPLCTRLPIKINVSEEANITFTVTGHCFLDNKKLLRIGVEDSFGTIHWASRKDWEKARQEYEGMI